MNKIFISYSRSDREAVNRIVKIIEQETGANCWVDLTGIESGSMFEDKIIQAIDNADVLLFMMSDQSLKSSWAKREVFYAEEKGKRVIPVSLDGKSLRGWAQFHFGNVNFIDVSSKEQMEKFLSDLRSWTDDSMGTDNASVSPHPKRWGRWVIPVGIAVISFILFLALWEGRGAGQGGRSSGQEASMSGPGSFADKGTDNNHEWVDLGTGVKWATCNVGASFPGDYGSHFAWGETESKTNYSWDNYRFRNSGNSSNSVKFSKYNTNEGKGDPDQMTRLDLEDDPARVAWGGDWRTPTKDEFEELLAACSFSWTSRNGHDGCLFISRSTGGQIFLPASGFSMADSLSHAGSYGHYWTSSLNEQRPEIAWYLFLDESGARIADRYRFVGRSVRPVRP